MEKNWENMDTPKGYYRNRKQIFPAAGQMKKICTINAQPGQAGSLSAGPCKVHFYTLIDNFLTDCRPEIGCLTFFFIIISGLIKKQVLINSSCIH